MAQWTLNSSTKGKFITFKVLIFDKIIICYNLITAFEKTEFFRGKIFFTKILISIDVKVKFMIIKNMQSIQFYSKSNLRLTAFG